MDVADILAELKPISEELGTVSKDLKALLAELRKGSDKKDNVYKEDKNVFNPKDFGSVIKTLNKNGDLYKLIESTSKTLNKNGDLYKAIIDKNTRQDEVLKSIRETFKSFSEQALMKPVETVLTKAPEPAQKESATDLALRDDTQKVKLVDIEPDAIKKLKSIFGKKIETRAPMAAAKVEPQGESKGLLGKLLDMGKFGAALKAGLLPLMAGLGTSFALAIGSWFNDGPFKGLMKEIGNIGVKVFLPKVIPIVTKLLPSIAKFLIPIAKNIPGIGLIINIGSAVSRIIKGDVVGGLIDLASGIVGLVPGIGTAVSIGLGFLNAARDLSGQTDDAKKGKAPMEGNIFSVITQSVVKFGAKFLSKFKFLPVIGSLFQLASAYSHFKGGKVIQGLLDLIGGIAGLFPGVGTMISLVTSGINLLVDFMGSKEEKKEPVQEKTETGIMSKAWEWVKTKVSDIFKSYFGKIGKGWSELKEGNYIAGLSTWASMVPGFGWIGSLVSWLSTDKKAEEPNQPAEGAEGMFSNILTKIKGGVAQKYNALKESITGKISSIAGGASKAMDVVKDATIGALAKEWDMLKEGAMKMLKGFTKWVGAGWSKIKGWFTSKEKDPVKMTGVKNVAPSLGTTDKASFLKPVSSKAPNLKPVADKTEVPSKDEEWAQQYDPNDIKTWKYKPKVNSSLGYKAALSQNDNLLSSIKTKSVPSQQKEAPQTKAVSEMKPPVETKAVVHASQPVIKTDNKLNEMFSKLINALKPQSPNLSTANSATVASSSDNSVANIYNNADRDIPYVERNKYRQQLLYVRGLL